MSIGCCGFSDSFFSCSGCDGLIADDDSSDGFSDRCLCYDVLCLYCNYCSDFFHSWFFDHFYLYD